VRSEVVECVWSQILRAADEQSFVVVAYCFMPDHLHLMVEGHSGTSDLKQFISRAKQYSGFHYSKRFNERLWQRYGFERVLRPEETTATVVRYILENPLRAGLARSVQEYPFLGSGLYTLAELVDYVQSHSKQSD
jgi:putative transposase